MEKSSAVKHQLYPKCMVSLEFDVIYVVLTSSPKWDGNEIFSYELGAAYHIVWGMLSP